MKPLPRSNFALALNGGTPELNTLLPVAWKQLTADFARANVALVEGPPSLKTIVDSLQSALQTGTDLKALAYLVDADENALSVALTEKTEANQLHKLAVILWGREVEKVWFRQQFSEGI